MELKKIKDIFSFEKGSLQSTKSVEGQYDFITASSNWKTHNSFDYDCEALIVAVAASGSLGRVHYANGKFISSDLCFILKPKDSKKFPVNLEFFYSIFKSLKEDLVKSTATGTAKKSINKTNFGNYVIPYYNIEEQNRLKPVFEKVADNSEKINFELSNQKQLLSKLKQSILKEAIAGKLTADWRKQNSNTESASELLGRIKTEKKQLIKEKQIKKEKTLPPITENELPYELPKSWTWCRLGDICNNITSGSTPSKDSFISNEIPYLKVYNIRNQNIDFFYKPQYIKKSIHESSLKRCILKPGDVVMNIVGPPLGKVAIIPETFPEWNCNQAISIFRCIEGSINPFIYQYLCAGFYLNYLHYKGMAGQDNISVTMCKELVIGLPPLAEQKVILDKINSLMQKQQELEQEVKTSEANAQMLMQAVLKEAFESKKEEVII